jgi:hypothetical protein
VVWVGLVVRGREEKELPGPLGEWHAPIWIAPKTTRGKKRKESKSEDMELFTTGYIVGLGCCAACGVILGCCSQLVLLLGAAWLSGTSPANETALLRCMLGFCALVLFIHRIAPTVRNLHSRFLSTWGWFGGPHIERHTQGESTTGFPLALEPRI